MKYIAFFDIRPEDYDKVIELQKKRTSSGRTVKSLLPPHTIGKTTAGISGFAIFETEDETAIAEYVMAYTLAGKKIEVYPIWECSKSIEIWEKQKK